MLIAQMHLSTSPCEGHEGIHNSNGQAAGRKGDEVKKIRLSFMREPYFRNAFIYRSLMV